MKKIHITILLLVAFLTGCKKEETKTFSWVTDEVGILSQEEKGNLTTELKSLEDNIGSQMAILIIDSLNGITIEEFSLNKANALGLGRKDYDDGVLITLAMHTREVRIEVGYGLEKIIKDEVAAQIIREDMVGHFKAGNFYEGLHQAVGSITELIKTHEELIGQRP